MSAEKRDLLFKSLGQRNIIAVESRQKFTSRNRQAVIGGRDDASMFTADYPHARIGFVSLQPRERIIRRTVVDEDEFKVRKGLRKDALHGLVDVARAVIDAR